MGQRVVGLGILVVLKSLGWLYYGAPRWLRRAWVEGIARFLNALEWRGKVIRQNFSIAFGEQQKVSLLDAYRQMAHLVVEILMLLGPLRHFIKNESELLGVEHWQEAIAQGKGALFLSSHVGNWEVMSGTGAMKGKMDLLIVTKRLKPEWLHHAIEKGRLACGYRGTYEPRTMKDILAQLKKKLTVGFVLDQYAGPPVGIRVPFFGVPVGTHSVVALVAKRSGAPVLPVVNYRLPDGRFRVIIEPPLEWIANGDPEKEIALNTAHYTAVIERHVKTYPKQWLWTHHRFKGDLSPLREEEWSHGRGAVQG